MPSWKPPDAHRFLRLRPRVAVMIIHSEPAVHPPPCHHRKKTTTTNPAPAKAGIVTAGLLFIGDEILIDRTKNNINGNMAEYLATMGIDLPEVRVVSDTEEEIVAAVDALRTRYTYLFTTGNIRPTHGDITADCVA